MLAQARDRLAELGAGGPERDARELAATLARRIRAGELDAELPLLIDRLREHVARKLEIARPGYSG